MWSHSPGTAFKICNDYAFDKQEKQNHVCFSTFQLRLQYYLCSLIEKYELGNNRHHFKKYLVNWPLVCAEI